MGWNMGMRVANRNLKQSNKYQLDKDAQSPFVIDLRKSHGLSITAIAKDLKISVRMVTEILKEAGLHKGWEWK